MNASFVFWCGALLNMAILFGLMLKGVREVRRGDVKTHQRSMIAATSLVGFFLVSYLCKVAFLGKEDFSQWSSLSVWTLRIHETCVLVMLVAGVVALLRARVLRTTRNVTKQPDDPMAPDELIRAHKRGGKVAVVSAGLGLLTAAAVLVGMYGRL